MPRARSHRSRGALRGLGHLVVLEKTVTAPFKAAFGRIKDHLKCRITGKANGISNGETVHKLKNLMKELEAEKRGQAEEMKAILAQRGEEQYFVHPASGHVYAVTGRYPYRIAGLLDAVWGFMDGPAGPFALLPGLSGSSGLAYTTYDVWGQPVYGMPIRAYKESEDEAFMQSMERQEAPFAKYVDPRWGEAPYPGTVKRGMAPPRYIIDKPSGWVDGLLGDDATSYSIWKLDSVLTGHWWGANYGIPYYGKGGKLKMALGRHQWEAEEQFQQLQQAGVVEVPYHGEVDPTQFGFDTATRMG